MKNQVMFDLLANYYSLYLKTQSYHWNITGMHFVALHEMLGKHYEELAENVDEIAERIRMLGEKVPASFSNFKSASLIKDPNENLDYVAMLKDLLGDHKTVIGLIDNAVAKYDQDIVTVDFLTEKKAYIEKIIWMLSSLLA